ncbi:helix-turn-helix transcriptional regulator [Pseudorhodoferax sp.]|uniref:helix-turn-helix transcriptional regulator n=1 Tax=Pseudorhodoferax sp. TaxID=1993553 RepID=UPI002DD62588|nr:helix-turn-helix transcriptional regulator [Pseudorhodoferax sp.]
MRDWQHALAAEGVQAIVVLGPELQGGPSERRVLAVHPVDAHQAARALARSPDFGEGPHRMGTPPVAWQQLARPLRLPEAEVDAQWRGAWQALGPQAVVRVGFGLPAGRSVECFLFVAEEVQQRNQAAMLGWLAQGFWPTLRAALVAVWCPLTRRELECLRLAFDGLTARASAERMACTERTVNFHLANAMYKLDADNKMAAIQRACWLGAL